MTDIPHETTQSTTNSLTHVGIMLLLVVGLLVAATVGTFLGRVDVLTVALVDMRQQCMEQPK